jgi:hypothetical protein
MNLTLIEEWYHFRIQAAMTNEAHDRVRELSLEYLDFLRFAERFN